MFWAGPASERKSSEIDRNDTTRTLSQHTNMRAGMTMEVVNNFPWPLARFDVDFDRAVEIWIRIVMHMCLSLAFQGEVFRCCETEDEFRLSVFELLSIYGV